MESRMRMLRVQMGQERKRIGRGRRPWKTSKLRKQGLHVCLMILGVQPVRNSWNITASTGHSGPGVDIVCVVARSRPHTRVAPTRTGSSGEEGYRLYH